MDFSLACSAPRLKARHRRYLKRYLPQSLTRVFNIQQIHGRRVILATRRSYQVPTKMPKADAVITQEIGVPIAVRTADCLPIFFYDPCHHVIAVVHAGWRSTHKRIAEATLKLMREKFDTYANDLKVVFGPALRSCCYEVSKEFLRYFPQEVSRRNGRLFFDLAAANKRQLIALGVRPSGIVDRRKCTFCQPGYASYRRDAEQATRMLSVMMLKDEK